MSFLREQHEIDKMSDNSESEPEPSFQRSQSGKPQNQVDIAYLYAVPLIKKENGHEYSMGLPIDYQTEIDELISSLTET